MHLLQELKNLRDKQKEFSNQRSDNHDLYREKVKSLYPEFEKFLSSIDSNVRVEFSADLSTAYLTIYYNKEDLFSIYIRDREDRNTPLYSISHSSKDANSNSPKDLKALIILGKVTEYLVANGEEMHRSYVEFILPYNKVHEDINGFERDNRSNITKIKEKLTEIFVEKIFSEGTNSSVFYEEHSLKIKSIGPKQIKVELTKKTTGEKSIKVTSKASINSRAKLLIENYFDEVKDEVSEYYEKKILKEKMNNL